MKYAISIFLIISITNCNASSNDSIDDGSVSPRSPVAKIKWKDELERFSNKTTVSTDSNIYVNPPIFGSKLPGAIDSTDSIEDLYHSPIERPISPIPIKTTEDLYRSPIERPISPVTIKTTEEPKSVQVNEQSSCCDRICNIFYYIFHCNC